MNLLRRLLACLLLVSLSGAVASAQDAPDVSTLDPEVFDAAAREDPTNLEVVRSAMRVWLARASAAAGAEDWSSVERIAERVLTLFYTAEGGRGSEEPLAPEAATAFMAQGRAAAKSGEPRLAADRYREAGALHSTPEAWMSAADLASRLEDWHQAREDLERALEHPGVPPDAYLRLAEVLYQSGETSAAIEKVEEGVEAGADRNLARVMLGRFRREDAVEGAYSSAGGTHRFAIYFENTSEQQDLRDRVLGSLERVYDRVTRLLEKHPVNAVPVVIYPSENVYQSVSGAPSWTAAAYNGKIRVPTGDLTSTTDEALDRVLAHEFSHYLIERLAGKRAPAWLQEGLAQHAEAGGEPPAWLPGMMRRVLKRYEDEDFPITVRQLEGRFHGMQGGGVHVAYGVSYYAVQYLLESGGMYRLQNFMAALQKGTPVEDALYQEIFVDYDGLDRHWRELAGRRLGL